MVLLIFVNFCLFIKIFAILSKKTKKKKTPNKSQMSYKCEWVLAVPPIL
jgi:hypothetical protein